MPKVTIKRGGATIETELTVAELKELAGLNGHKGPKFFPRYPESAPSSDQNSERESATAFFADLSEQGRQFLGFVKAAGREGLSAEGAVTNMKLPSRYSIGGLTGGGLSKLANKHGLNIRDIYKKESSSINGVRTVLFKPGKLLEYLN